MLCRVVLGPEIKAATGIVQKFLGKSQKLQAPCKPAAIAVHAPMRAAQVEPVVLGSAQAELADFARGFGAAKVDVIKLLE